MELLLDAVLIERQHTLLDAYYNNLRDIDHDKIQLAANKICRKPVLNLTALVPRFVRERFLADYGRDDTLLYRLNGVMKRIGLPLLPVGVIEWLASARPRVRSSADLLLTSPN